MTSTLNNVAASPEGLSCLANNTATSCTNVQQAIQKQEQALLNGGVPSSVDQTSWAADLQARSLVSSAFEAVLSQQDYFLQQLNEARQQGNQTFND